MLNSLKRRTQKIIMVLAVGVSIGTAVAPVPAMALFEGSKTEACRAINADGTGTCESGDKVSGLLKTAVEILSFLVGIAAIIMVIFGGLRYVLAAGDPAKINSAKNTILYALIGIGVAVMAQVLVRFVLSKV